MKIIKAFVENIFKRNSCTKKTISVKDACIIAKKASVNKKIIECLDYGEFYVFTMVPETVPDNLDLHDEKITEYPIYVGLVCTAVRKRNGKVFWYDIASDLEAYKSAKPIPLENL